MKTRTWIRFALLLIVGVAIYWQRGGPGDGEARSGGGVASIFSEIFSGKGDPASSPGTLEGQVPPAGSDAPSASGTADATKKTGPYDTIEGCRWIEDEGNDGDSFLVEHGGREIHLRLYFVDAPESYLHDYYESQQRRVADQAGDFGGISLSGTVAAGQEAKAFTREQLAGKSFTVHTYWEPVFDSERRYGFVELPGEGGTYLGEELVRRGLARIHTKGPGSKEDPVPTPRGDSFHQHRDRLYQMEREAKRAKAGAWGKGG